MKNNKHNNPWRKELIYGVLFILLAIASSILTKFWAWSFCLWLVIYILWKWVEVYYFYHWYKGYPDIENTPLSSGIWEELCCLVINNKKKNIEVETKNKELIQQFESMSQALPYATILLNKRDEVIWVNHASQNILGIFKDQDEGSKIDNIIRDSVFIQLLEDDKEKIKEIKFAHTKDENRKIHLKIIELSEDRSLLVARDISEQESLRQSRKAFVANASHELRTPLTVIAGYLEMMQSSDSVPNQWEMAINQSIRQSTRMGNIINDMLKLSSIEHDQYLERNYEEIKMPSLLNRLFNDVKNSSKAKHHNFIANIDSELNIRGNEEEIISICLNLLNNAVIHTMVNTEISLRWFKQQNKANLWVCDNGQGIEQKHLIHLTERFYCVDNSRDKNKNSTGLGLAIVKQICDNHNAKLEVDSEVGQGTCFKVGFLAERMEKI